MHLDWATFAFQTINVVVLLALLRHFLFRPIARIIAERQAATDKVLLDAEAAKTKAAEAEAAAQAAEQQITASRTTLLESARAEAETQRTVILADAAKEAAVVLTKAADAVRQHDRDGAKDRMTRATDLAVTITRRLLDQLPAEARISGYPARLQAALATLSSEERAALLSGNRSLHLIAPRVLTEAETRAAQDALAILTDTPLGVTVDETLLAGLELSGSHGALHNSLKHDLDQIAKALNGRPESP
jgi:F-type H+-transporting ATPase subunit b